MTTAGYIDLTAVLTNAALGLFVLARAPRGPVQRAFTSWVFSISIWTLGIVGLGMVTGHRAGYACSVATFVGSNLLAASMVWFVGLFGRPNSKRLDLPLTFWVLIGVSFAALAPLGLFGRDVEMTRWGWRPVPGLLSSAGALYIFCSLLFFLVALVDRWRKSQGLERLQVRYLLLGSLITVTVAITTNLVLPQVFHNRAYGQIGPAATLVFVAFAGYAIARFRLLDISTLVQRSIAYSLAIAALSLAFVLAVVGINSFAAPALAGYRLGAQAAVAMILAMLFQPAYQAIHRLLSALFFRRPFDYARELRSFSREMASVMDFRSLREQIVRRVRDLLQVESTVLALYNGAVWQFGDGTRIESPGSASDTFIGPDLWAQMMTGVAVVREEAAQSDRKFDHRVADAMARLQSDVCVPLVFKENLTGVLLIGSKRSGGAFTDPDISLLSTLANQAAISIRNSQLFSELRQSHQYNQAILHHLDTAVVTVDLDGGPIVANEAAEQLLRWPGSAISLPPILRAAAARVCRSGREEANLEFEMLAADGSLLPVVATVCPFFDETGEADSALVMIRDISVLRRLEDERLRVQHLSDVSRVASSLAHEIRNPLAAIKTFCQLLPERYADPDFRETFASIAFEEVERIDLLVARLLGPRADVEGRWEAAKVQDALEATLKLLRPMAEERGLHLGCPPVPDLQPIQGDAAQLRQLFLNLVLNAMDASPAGGQVEVQVYPQDCPESGAAGVVVQIANGGAPIPAANLPQLFEPFFTTKETGTGLGLTVCKQIVDYHRGRIDVTSTAEEGTLFRIWLPQNAAGPGLANPPRPAALLPDDSPEKRARPRVAGDYDAAFATHPTPALQPQPAAAGT